MEVIIKMPMIVQNEMYQFGVNVKQFPQSIVCVSFFVAVVGNSREQSAYEHTISMHAMYRMIYYYRNSKEIGEGGEKSKWKIRKI